MFVSMELPYQWKLILSSTYEKVISDHLIIYYLNLSIGSVLYLVLSGSSIKAESDVCCVSSYQFGYALVFS